MRHLDNDRYRETHTLRVMASLAVALLLLVAAVKLWPAPSGEASAPQLFSTRGQEVIQMEEIVRTSQAHQTPPPPAPLPPVVVPDDVVLDEVELDFTDSFLPVLEPGTDRLLKEGAAEGTPARLARADTDPKPVRIVEPKYTREANRKRIRAEVVVEVFIDEKGRVQESKILERFLLEGKDDTRTPVAEIGYGLEEAALSAAERWLFRPARENGKPVGSYYTFTLSFGV